MDGNHYLPKKSRTHERWRPLNAFSNTLQRDVTVHDSVVLGKRKLADVHLNPNILNHLFKLESCHSRDMITVEGITVFSVLSSYPLKNPIESQPQLSTFE